MCGTRCVNLQTDTTQCGMCGRACPSGSTCNAGACSTVCASGQTQCSGRCVNVQTDAAHCGACGMACAAGTACSAGRCGSSNDASLGAGDHLGAAETTVTGTTVGATHDGPTVPCGCTSGRTWCRSRGRSARWCTWDTAGSALDTSLLITDSSGAAVPRSRPRATTLGPATTTAAAGRARASPAASNSRTAGCWAPEPGTSPSAAAAPGPSRCGCSTRPPPWARSSMTTGCRETAPPRRRWWARELPAADLRRNRLRRGRPRWFATCGARQQFFSLCASDGGTTRAPPSAARTSTRRSTSAARSPAPRPPATTTAAPWAAVNRRGTGFGADSAGYGSRLNNVTTARGLHGLVVDERSGGSGMSYTLRYIVR
nr:hypothetical protein [Deltaproteobacteria bacterium]